MLALALIASLPLPSGGGQQTGSVVRVAPPVVLVDPPRVVCPGVARLKLRLRSRLAMPIFAALHVQRLDGSGHWEEFVADVLGSERHPKKVRVHRIEPGAAVVFDWQLTRTGHRDGLPEGRYRVTANCSGEGATRWRGPVAEFVVEASAPCRE